MLFNGEILQTEIETKDGCRIEIEIELEVSGSDVHVWMYGCMCVWISSGSLSRSLLLSTPELKVRYPVLEKDS